MAQAWFTKVTATRRGESEADMSAGHHHRPDCHAGHAAAMDAVCLPPSRSALLLVDLQNGTPSGAAGGDRTPA
jgi:hypothetical protein